MGRTSHFSASTQRRTPNRIANAQRPSCGQCSACPPPELMDRVKRMWSDRFDQLQGLEVSTTGFGRISCASANYLCHRISIGCLSTDTWAITVGKRTISPKLRQVTVPLTKSSAVPVPPARCLGDNVRTQLLRRLMIGF